MSNLTNKQSTKQGKKNTQKEIQIQKKKKEDRKMIEKYLKLISNKMTIDNKQMYFLLLKTFSENKK